MTQVEAHRHLFIDDYEIDSMSGLSRSLHGATLYEGNPVIHNDYPWERYVIKSGGTYLLQDPNDGLFKLGHPAVPCLSPRCKRRTAGSMSLGITKSGPISHFSPSVRDRHFQRSPGADGESYAAWRARTFALRL